MALLVHCSTPGASNIQIRPNDSYPHHVKPKQTSVQTQVILYYRMPMPRLPKGVSA